MSCLHIVCGGATPGPFQQAGRQSVSLECLWSPPPPVFSPPRLPPSLQDHLNAITGVTLPLSFISPKRTAETGQFGPMAKRLHPREKVKFQEGDCPFYDRCTTVEVSAHWITAAEVPPARARDTRPTGRGSRWTRLQRSWGRPFCGNSRQPWWRASPFLCRRN